MREYHKNKPDFIIIGAMKCATTTLHDQLQMNSTFFMSTPKEPNFFSDDSVYARGEEWYSSLFTDADIGQLRGESSTHYAKLPRYPSTLKRMRAFCPDVKCIYMMRHPIDRLVSHYIHEWTQGVISCGIDEAVYTFPELVEYSRYNMQIDPYLNSFGELNVLPVFVERLKKDPIAELRTICSFLGVDEDVVWHSAIKSNVSVDRLRVCKWRDFFVRNRFLTIVRRTIIPKDVRRRIRSLWTMKQRPELSLKSLQYVQEVLDSDLKLLGERFDLELNCTNFKSVLTAHNDISWISTNGK